MIERKHSLSFIEFLRGKYKLEDKVFFAIEVDGNDILYMDDGLIVHS